MVIEAVESYYIIQSDGVNGCYAVTKQVRAQPRGDDFFKEINILMKNIFQ